MSPRPRTLTDDEILAAVPPTAARVGPARVTLAAVGEACGLSAAALVQRFGSRRGLLLAFARRGEARLRDRFARARREERSPLLALVEALAAPAAELDAPEALSNHLAFLQADLADPAFHAHALAEARAAREEIRALLDGAAAAGELAPCDTAELARTLQTTAAGALATWTLFREGSADDWIRDELEAVLAPYLGA
jgi:AcrR family transcriptional regulator